LCYTENLIPHREREGELGKILPIVETSAEWLKPESPAHAFNAGFARLLQPVVIIIY